MKKGMFIFVLFICSVSFAAPIFEKNIEQRAKDWMVGNPVMKLVSDRSVFYFSLSNNG